MAFLPGGCPGKIGGPIAVQFQRRLQISQVKNIGNVFELSSVAFRLAPAYGGLLVKCHPNKKINNSRVFFRSTKRMLLDLQLCVLPYYPCGTGGSGLADGNENEVSKC